VDACSDAVRPRACIVSDDPSTSSARVVWNSPTDATIVLDIFPDRPSRRLVFRSDDAEADRWQSAGLVVAALFLDRAHDDAERDFHDETPPPRRLPRVWANVATRLGNGLASGPIRYGGAASVGYALPSLPVFAELEASYTVAFRNVEGVRPSWSSFVAGVGPVVDVRSLDLVLRPRAQLLLERLDADVSRDPAHSDAGERWLTGAGLSLALAWPVRTPVSLFAETDANFLTGATGVRVMNQDVSSFPAVFYGVGLGVSIVLGR